MNVDDLKTQKDEESAPGAAGTLASDQDYDPFVHRPPGPKTSTFGTFMHLMKAATATGILFLPNAFRRTGYVMAIVCSIFIGLIYTHNSVILVRCAHTLCRRHRIPQLDYAGTVRVSFLSGPKKFQACGNSLGHLTNIVICFIQYMTIVIYILYVAGSFQQIIEFFLNISLDTRIYIIIFFPIYCLMILVPNLKYLTPISTIGTIFFAFGIIVSFIYFFEEIPHPKHLDAFTTVLSVPMYCAIFLYALHNITVLMTLENNMANPAKMPLVVGIATIINMMIYAAFGFLGYNKYKESCDTVIKNLPLDEIFSELVKIGITLSVLFSIGIAYFVPVKIVWPIVMHKYDFTPGGEPIFRLIGMGIATFVAIAVPQMIPLIGFLAAIGMTCSMLLFPMLVELNTKWQEGTYFLYIKAGSIFVIFILISIIGVFDSFYTIINEYTAQKEKGC